MSNQKGFGVAVGLLVVLFVLIVGLVGWQILSRDSSTATRSIKTQNNHTPTLIDKTYCSDVCPQNTQTFKIYEGVDSQAECEKINGQTLLDAAYHSYIGCRPKGNNQPSATKV